MDQGYHSASPSVQSARYILPLLSKILLTFKSLQVQISHSSLQDLLDPINSLYEDVKKKALMRLEYEGLSKCEAVSSPGARWFNDPSGIQCSLVTNKNISTLPAGFAMDRYAYYVCFKCGKAYFGGEARCDIEAGGGDTFNPEELVCGGCSDVSQV